jgi:hypothetical protein
VLGPPLVEDPPALQDYRASCVETSTRMKVQAPLREAGYRLPNSTGGAELADPDGLPDNPAIYVVDLLLPEAGISIPVSVVRRCDSRAESRSAQDT